MMMRGFYVYTGKAGMPVTLLNYTEGIQYWFMV